MSAFEILEKLASMSGHDFRHSLLERPNFPTMDSTDKARTLLRGSQKVSEHTFTKQPTIKSLSPKMFTNKGSIPKIGEVMSDLQNDPLIQYLKKQAEVLDTNESSDVEEEDRPLSMTSGDPEAQDAANTVSEHFSYLSRVFNARPFRKKYTQKDV